MAKKEKVRVDNSEFYKHTESKVRDAIFNWVVRRYERNSHVWQKSDEVVWNGAIYHVSGYFGYLIVIGLLWWLLDATVRLKGGTHAILLLMILMFVQLLRLNSIMRKIDRDISK